MSKENSSRVDLALEEVERLQFNQREYLEKAGFARENLGAAYKYVYECLKIELANLEQVHVAQLEELASVKVQLVVEIGVLKSKLRHAHAEIDKLKGQAREEL